MALQAFFLSTLVMMVIGIGLLDVCHFLVPYKVLILTLYAKPIALYVGALYVNLFAGFYFASRHLFLKDTGRKLAHLERQFRTGSSTSPHADRLDPDDVIDFSEE